jgi:hypothetical protein
VATLTNGIIIKNTNKRIRNRKTNITVFFKFCLHVDLERKKDHLKKETVFETLCVLCVLTTEKVLINISVRN